MRSPLRPRALPHPGFSIASTRPCCRAGPSHPGRPCDGAGGCSLDGVATAALGHGERRVRRVLLLCPGDRYSGANLVDVGLDVGCGYLLEP
jgi:hypothetical protein